MAAEWLLPEINVVPEGMFEFATVSMECWVERIILRLIADLEEESFKLITACMLWISANNEVTTYSILVSTKEPQPFIEPQLIMQVQKNNDNSAVVVSGPDFRERLAKTRTEFISILRDLMETPAIKTKLKTVYSAAFFSR